VHEGLRYLHIPDWKLILSSPRDQNTIITAGLIAQFACELPSYSPTSLTDTCSDASTNTTAQSRNHRSRLSSPTPARSTSFRQRYRDRFVLLGGGGGVLYYGSC
jgi:hypothetical protein